MSKTLHRNNFFFRLFDNKTNRQNESCRNKPAFYLSTLVLLFFLEKKKV